MKFKKWLQLSEVVNSNDLQSIKKYAAAFFPQLNIDQDLSVYISSPENFPKGKIIQDLQQKYNIQTGAAPKIIKDNPFVVELYKEAGIDINTVSVNEKRIIKFYSKENKEDVVSLAQSLRKLILENKIKVNFDKFPLIHYNGNQITAQNIHQLISKLHNVEFAQSHGEYSNEKANTEFLEFNYRNELVAKVEKGENGKPILVFKGKNPEQCQAFGKGQNWCVSQSSSVQFYFNYRHEHGQTQYFIFDFNKDPKDPARYVNPGVAEDGGYSEWVDAENEHLEDPDDENSEFGIRGYRSIDEYKT